jgi:hypothetical protein
MSFHRRFSPLVILLTITGGYSLFMPYALANAPAPEAEIPKDLVLRLLNDPDGRTHQPQLWQGLPPAERVPQSIPIGRNAEVIASVTFGQATTSILLRNSRTPQHVLAFYKKILHRQGWQPPPPQRFSSLPIDFVSSADSSALPMSNLVLCGKGHPQPASVAITAVPEPKNTSLVRITARWLSDPICRPPEGDTSLDDRLPETKLSAPLQTTVQMEGSGGGRSNNHVYASIKTQLSPAALLTHYNQQMEQAGWQLMNAHQGKYLLSSLWTTTADQQRWLGVLNLIQIGTGTLPQRYQATLTALDLTQLAAADGPIATSTKETIAYSEAVEILRHLPESRADFKLYGRRLPPNLPVPVPILAKTDILGSLVTQEPLPTFDLLLETDHTGAQIKAFYTEQLQKQGWRSYGVSDRHQQGFASNTPFILEAYCQSEQGPQLLLSTWPLANGRTDLRVSLQLQSDNAGGTRLLCQESELEHSSNDPFAALPIPSLAPLQESQVSLLDFGLDNDTLFRSIADIRTTAALPEVMAHYQAQLQQSGWTLIDQSLDGSVYTGNWSKQDGKRWMASLIINRMDGLPHRYAGLLHIAAQQVP